MDGLRVICIGYGEVTGAGSSVADRTWEDDRSNKVRVNGEG
jgi:hypothetical protein